VGAVAEEQDHPFIFLSDNMSRIRIDRVALAGAPCLRTGILPAVALQARLRLNSTTFFMPA